MVNLQEPLGLVSVRILSSRNCLPSILGGDKICPPQQIDVWRKHRFKHYPLPVILGFVNALAWDPKVWFLVLVLSVVWFGIWRVLDPLFLGSGWFSYTFGSNVIFLGIGNQRNERLVSCSF